MADEFPKRRRLTPAGQFCQLIEFGLGEHSVFHDVVECAGRHFGDIQAIERIVAIRTVAVFRARLPVSDAGTTIVTATASATTACLRTYGDCFIHGLAAPVCKNIGGRSRSLLSTPKKAVHRAATMLLCST